MIAGSDKIAGMLPVLLIAGGWLSRSWASRFMSALDSIADRLSLSQMRSMPDGTEMENQMVC